MSVSLGVLEAPSRETLDEWLDQPRLAKCGKLFTPSQSMWRPDKSNLSVNWKSAIASVSTDWQSWLHAALVYRMAEVEQSTLVLTCSILSRAAQEGLDPLKEDHIIDLRERFASEEFSTLSAFMVFWQSCESLEQRPDQSLADSYSTLPRKKRSRRDVVLSLDPEAGPFTQIEQDALYQWMHEEFCHGSLDPERYLYLRILMVYGVRGVQARMCVFDDFVKNEKGYRVRFFWAKQKGGNGGFRKKFEYFHLDGDLYSIVQAYKEIVLTRLKNEYPGRADWGLAIKNVPLFRRKLANRIAYEDGIHVPVIVEHDDFSMLEKAPESDFHITVGSTKKWLERLEKREGFPISHRTHLPLKISKGHRFRHTMGTDLSNAGLDEWAIANALMHKNTHTVRRYRQISAELMMLIDAKMSDHLALSVNAFAGTIVADRKLAKNGGQENRQIEDLAVCGSDAACHLDAPLSCYGCSKFQPLLHADHSASLGRMERYRAQAIAEDQVTGAIWDRAILACRKVILDCKAIIETVSKSRGDV